MNVRGVRTIFFRCEKCNGRQVHPYSLEPPSEFEDFPLSDNIDCTHCKHVNHVVEEMERGGESWQG